LHAWTAAWPVELILGTIQDDIAGELTKALKALIAA
jgi:hypothetical protein